MAYWMEDALTNMVALSPSQIARMEAEKNRKRDRCGSIDLFHVSHEALAKTSPRTSQRFPVMKENISHSGPSRPYSNRQDSTLGGNKFTRNDEMCSNRISSTDRVTPRKSKFQSVESVSSPCFKCSDEWFRHDLSNQLDLNKAIIEDSFVNNDSSDADQSTELPNKHPINENISKCTCGGSWFVNHDCRSGEGGECRMFCFKERDGELDPTRRVMQESECWFDFDANKKFQSPRPRLRVNNPELLERAYGSQMRKIFGLE